MYYKIVDTPIFIKCGTCFTEFSFEVGSELNGIEQAIIAARDLGSFSGLFVVHCSNCGSYKIYSKNENKLLVEFNKGESPRDVSDSVLINRKRRLRKGLMRFRVWRSIIRIIGKPTKPFRPSYLVRECSICHDTWRLPVNEDNTIRISMENLVGLTCLFCGMTICSRCYGSLPGILPGGECLKCDSKLTIN